MSDALTLYAWRAPALRLAAAGFPAIAFIAAEALLSLIIFALFWHGRYWLGLAISVAVMILSATSLAAGRSRLWQSTEIVFPLAWWWAWVHGLAAYGRPLDPVYSTMVLWVVVGGGISIAVIEALSIHRFNGMEIHAWQPFDSHFRLVAASRNVNLAILTAGLLAGRPDSGFVGVAWWTLLSLIAHSVRLAQLTERQARRQTVKSWLER